MKVIIHPTWECQFRCPYCSVHAQGLESDTRVLAWKQWADWICQLPPGSVVEISGGEPTLYLHLGSLLGAIVEKGFSWGLTTNAAHMPVVMALVEAQARNCLALNVSIQPESPPDIVERAETLREAGYPVNLNWVDHPDSPPVPDGFGFGVNRIPYQAWAEGDALDGVRRVCSAGSSHLCCDPSGRVYRCLVHLQLGVGQLGTIAEPLHGMTLRGVQPCDTGCSSCYTVMPEAWAVKMRRIQYESVGHGR